MIPSPTVLLVAVIAVLAAAVGGFSFGSSTANNRWEAKWADRERLVAETVASMEAENRRIESEKTAALKEANDAHQIQVEALRRNHAAAVARLRNDSKRAALKPAEDAPAECRDHAASPAQLSGADAEFLVDFAAEADRLAAQLAALQRYVREVVKP